MRTIEVKQELTFNDLEEQCWSGACDTLRTIWENDKEEEFMDLLFDLYHSEVPTLTTINDLLWFDDEYIFEQLGINNADTDEDTDDLDNNADTEIPLF